MKPNTTDSVAHWDNQMRLPKDNWELTVEGWRVVVGGKGCCGAD